MERLGPTKTGSTDKYYHKSLLNFLESSYAYVYSLDDFSKYIVWRYTIGSATINTYMITGNLGMNAGYWCFLFFKYLFNTDPNMVVDSEWMQFRKYMLNPQSFQSLDKDTQMSIAGVIVPLYIKKLKMIILRSPEVNEGFHVYKSSSRYPTIPSTDDIKLASKQLITLEVIQNPFNSTSYNPNFNYDMFRGEGVVWDIYIGKGQHVLGVPDLLHAYPFEDEIILLPGVFDILSSQIVTLGSIEKDDFNLNTVQNTLNIMEGPVFMINEIKPCKTGNCEVKDKKVELIRCIYTGPFSGLNLYQSRMNSPS